LVQRGIDVTLFATADSVTTARLASVCPLPYSEDPSIDTKIWESLHIAAVFERAGEFDLIHNHFDFLPLSYSRLIRTPLVTTIHGFSSDRILPVYEKYNDRSHYIAISHADRNPRLTYLATIHHGIKVEDFPFCSEAGDYLLFFGRIHHEKGTAEAIRVATRAGLPLIIAGIIQDSAYFEREIAPHIDDGYVRYVGSVGPDLRGKLLAAVRPLLHLIDFREPFGLSMVEAMACGTPVIARPLGAVPEIVSAGQTGFLVDSCDAAVEAVERVRSLDRAGIRRHVDKNLMSGKRLSYQRHSSRSEHWTVVHGAGTVTVEGCETFVRTGETADIPMNAAHRIANSGTEPLVFIEVQRGSYLGEDDIIRLQDDFGRVPEEAFKP